MARLEIILILSAAVLFCGCGGTPAPAPGSAAQVPSSPSQIPPAFGNWQFSAASTVPGKPPLTFAGSIGQAGTAVTSALHVDGSNCFDRLTTVSFTSTETGNTTSLTSATVDGQVVTFTGNFSGYAFNGTYKISGGCDAGDHGTLTGINIWNIGNKLSGNFTNSAQKTFNVVGKIAQSDIANADGSFPITGTATFDTPCLSAGTIEPGALPSGSLILGMSVALQVDTSNGVLTFHGTLDQSGDGAVSGNYTVSGGGCEDSGTGVLQVAAAWDY
jgi:hypothetical protein